MSFDTAGLEGLSMDDLVFLAFHIFNLIRFLFSIGFMFELPLTSWLAIIALSEFLMANWLIFAVLILIWCAVSGYSTYAQDSIANSPYVKLFNSMPAKHSCTSTILPLVSTLIFGIAIVVIIISITRAIASDYGIVLSFFWVLIDSLAVLTLAVAVLFLMKLCINSLLSSLPRITSNLLGYHYAMRAMSSDKQKFGKIYTDDEIRKFIHDKDVFALNELLKDLYKANSMMPENEPAELEIAAFVMKKRFDKHFITVKGDLPDSSYDAYCMSLGAYDNLKKELEDFLRGADAHDIDYITKNTTGISSRAYFIQKALYDLVDSGNIIAAIADNLKNESNTSDIVSIYKHKYPQKPMESREINRPDV